MSEREVWNEFVAAHGGKAFNSDFGVWLCPDGAEMRNSGVCTVYVNPPDDPRGQLLARRRYHKAVLDAVEGEAEKLDAALRGVAYPYRWNERVWGKPHKDGKAALRFFKSLAEQERKAYEELDRQLEARHV